MAAPPSVTDLDGSIEALVRTVDPSVVQIFISGLAPREGVVGGQADLVTPVRASGSGVIGAMLFIAAGVSRRIAPMMLAELAPSKARLPVTI